MEFDNGSDVQPGHDITIDSSQGSQDLGEATYDSDHDGIADSVIVIDGDHEYVVTDSDHDGHADSMHAYDAHGTEVDPQTGAPVGDSGTDGGSTTSGHTGTSTSGTDTGTDSTGTDTGASSHTNGTTTDSSGTSSSTTSGTNSSGSDTSSGTSSGTSTGGHDITVTGDDGSAHSLGVPTVDLDKDGSADTAVQHNDDGSITGYTDRDGDGHADQITQIGADGKVVIAVSDGNGGWQVAATGHMDSSGALVQDTTPDPTAALSGTDSDGVTTGHAGGTSSGTTTGTSTSGTTDHGSTSTTTDGGSTSTADTSTATTSGGSAGTEDAPGTQVAAGHAPAGDITFTEGGKDYDLGAPTADMNGDGTPDTVVTHLDDGTVVAYSDTDGDGTTDQVTQLAPDGQVTIGVPDGHGGWQQAATGHIGSDGKFVPDQTTAGASTG
ncbi:hypothetical protein ABIB25_002651 [Nakamurella sp. UYEF19]|uniref:DUF6802 family protein n=1 Tax=Nakamurella sp. UYEF19 TaxID=1756392 RepID=UPI00339AF97E